MKASGSTLGTTELRSELRPDDEVPVYVEDDNGTACEVREVRHDGVRVVFIVDALRDEADTEIFELASKFLRKELNATQLRKGLEEWIDA